MLSGPTESPPARYRFVDGIRCHCTLSTSQQPLSYWINEIPDLSSLESSHESWQSSSLGKYQNLARSQQAHKPQKSRNVVHSNKVVDTNASLHEGIDRDAVTEIDNLMPALAREGKFTRGQVFIYDHAMTKPGLAVSSVNYRCHHVTVFSLTKRRDCLQEARFQPVDLSPAPGSP